MAARLPRRSSCNALWTAPHGLIWISQEPPWGPRKPRSIKVGVQDLAFGYSIGSWQIITNVRQIRRLCGATRARREFRSKARPGRLDFGFTSGPYLRKPAA